MNPYRYMLQRIEERGWIQGEFITRDGVCLMGAGIGLRNMGCVSWSDPLMSKIAKLFPDRSAVINLFNDDPRTTKEDIIMLLEKCAIEFDEKEGLENLESV